MTLTPAPNRAKVFYIAWKQDQMHRGSPGDRELVEGNNIPSFMTESNMVPKFKRTGIRALVKGHGIYLFMWGSVRVVTRWLKCGKRAFA